MPRKLIVQEFLTLDGVMQAPGGSKEDEAEGFRFGGWTAPFADVAFREAASFLATWMESTDILLGKNTYQIFAGFWPSHESDWPGINDVTKYVASSTLSQSDIDAMGWKNSQLITGIDDIKNLKESDGGIIKVHGSGNLAQSLFKHDLVDELHLMTFPVMLGSGKRLFADGVIPVSYKMLDSIITSNGVVICHLQRDGDVQTGEIGS